MEIYGSFFFKNYHVVYILLLIQYTDVSLTNAIGSQSINSVDQL